MRTETPLFSTHKKIWSSIVLFLISLCFKICNSGLYVFLNFLEPPLSHVLEWHCFTSFDSS
jgi:hypothetical protein